MILKMIAVPCLIIPWFWWEWPLTFGAEFPSFCAFNVSQLGKQSYNCFPQKDQEFKGNFQSIPA